MSIGSELGQYILQNTQFKKNSEDSMGDGEFEPPNPPSGYASGLLFCRENAL